MAVDARNRLQPSLLDRLTDDHRSERKGLRTALAMRRDDARTRGIRSIGDLADRSRTDGLRVGLSREFTTQSGGWSALRRFYDLALTPAAALDRFRLIEALVAKQFDLVDIAADASVDENVVCTLIDDRRFFIVREIEGDPARVLSKIQFRQAVLRDLSALFNAVQPLSGDEATLYPAVRDSVLNYGMPPLTGQLASKLDVTLLAAAIKETILRFEPRVTTDTLEVRAIESDSVLDTHNVIEFEIRGHLWSQPLPLEILLRTQLDLEAGQVSVREAS